MSIKHLVIMTTFGGFLMSPLSAVIAADEHSHGHKHEHDHSHEHEYRQHGSHVHGIASLNLVAEGGAIHIELDSPAANIVGFEHRPSSEDEHAALDNAVAKLRQGSELFVFDAPAGCRLEKAEVESALLDDDHGHDQHDHDKHDHDKHDHDKHDHDKHDHDKHDHDKHDHDKHDHDKHDDDKHEASHADIKAAYHFECSDPGNLSQLKVELFDAFSGMEKLDVQYITDSGQGAAELTPASHVIAF